MVVSDVDPEAVSAVVVRVDAVVRGGSAAEVDVVTPSVCEVVEGGAAVPVVVVVVVAEGR